MSDTCSIVSPTNEFPEFTASRNAFISVSFAI